MNVPAKRFSLTRLMTSVPAEAKAEKPPMGSELRSVPEKPSALPIVAPVPASPEVLQSSVEIAEPALIEPRSEPSKAPPATALSPARTKAAPRQAVEESSPKKKRSYSVDMKVCEDLEVLAWYQGKSSSSVVEELVRKHLSQNRSLLIKAQDIRNAR